MREVDFTTQVEVHRVLYKLATEGYTVTTKETNIGPDGKEYTNTKVEKFPPSEDAIKLWLLMHRDLNSTIDVEVDLFKNYKKPEILNVSN